MANKKLITTLMILSVLFAVVNEFVFAASTVVTNDKILDGALQVLVYVQKYSWPVAILVLVFALYKYYVTGSEVLADQVKGKSLLTGLCIFMAVVQCLPLVYAILIL